ncbi:unnamed protein product [Brassica rapa subsp. trilocularis]
MASITLLLLAIILSSRTSGATSRGGLFEASAVAEKHEQWMARFHRVYSDESEKTNRFEIFKKNLEFVERHNMNTNITYTLDVSQFSDLTDEEFRARYMGLVVPEDMLRISSSGSDKRCRLDMKMSVTLARTWIGDRRGRLHPLRTKATVESAGLSRRWQP